MSARHWIGTLFDWTPPEVLPAGVVWLRGQQETCPTTGRLHWQVIASFAKTQRLGGAKRLVGLGHWEPTRSEAAAQYVWKEATAVPGTRFEFGGKPIRRNSSTDWDSVLAEAKTGNLENIPSDIQGKLHLTLVRYYRTLKSIADDHQVPPGIQKTVNVFYGRTGTGKSRRAWDEAGVDAFAKDPRSKWWDGYKGKFLLIPGEENVIIDEFRGAIDVSHMLRWLDRYPVRVERKGSSVALRARTFWITSNIPPEQWYQGLDEATLEALKRRLTNIIFFE